jgi:hypothetical protein
MRTRLLILGFAAAALGASVLGVVLTAPSASSNSTPSVRPDRYTDKVLRLSTGKPSQPPGLLIREVVARYGGHAVSSNGLGVGGPPAGWSPTEPGSPSQAAPSGLWINGTVPVRALGAPAVRPVWEANLVIAAVRDELHAQGASDDVIGSQISGEFPSGEVAPNIGGGIGNIVFGQAFSDATPAQAESSIRRNAAALKLRIIALDVLKPLQVAPAVVASTRDVAGVLSNPDAVINALFGGIATYEGEYLELRDASGSPFFIQASTFRTGVGQRWYRSDVDPRLPLPSTADGPANPG